MKVSQRDIVELPFYLLQGTLNHPAIELSCDHAIEIEAAFVVVLITSKKFDDEYTFQLVDGMLTAPMEKPYQEVRLHLVSLYRESDVIVNSKQRIRVKKDDFEIIVQQIAMSTFGIDF